jgi:hypothetical protein
MKVVTKVAEVLRRIALEDDVPLEQREGGLGWLAVRRELEHRRRLRAPETPVGNGSDTARGFP